MNLLKKYFMAEITSIKHNTGKTHYKSLRVDLTPMVDLGFLLITFFILTNTIQQKTELQLTLPKDSSAKTLVAASATLTFILNGHDSISYYDGFNTNVTHSTFTSMRKVIQQKQINLIHNHLDKNKLTIIIKPTAESTYKNLIDAIDEILITDCKHYFVAEPGKNEEK
jgi:biopolymer transport protein ExbD